MASYTISVEKAKAFLKSQYQSDEKFAQNMKLLRALGMFGGAVILFRNYGDVMGI